MNDRIRWSNFHGGYSDVPSKRFKKRFLGEIAGIYMILSFLVPALKERYTTEVKRVS